MLHGGAVGLLSAGATFLQMQALDENERPEVHGFRASLVDGLFQLDWEGARHVRAKGERPGIGQVVEASYLLGPFDLYAAYKHYRDMAVLAGGSKLMNQPPALIHDPRATLQGRHPHELDPNDEKGCDFVNFNYLMDTDDDGRLNLVYNDVDANIHSAFSQALSTVPEPGTTLLCLLGLVWLVRRR